MSQPSGWDFWKNRVLIRWHGKPPRAQQTDGAMEHSKLPTGWGTILKPPITFLFEGTGLSVRFWYLSEIKKQFKSNTIWKSWGGSHYLCTCHREEQSTLIFRRDWSHLGLAGITPPAALADYTTISSCNLFPLYIFLLKRLVERNPTIKVPNEAAPNAFHH